MNNNDGRSVTVVIPTMNEYLAVRKVITDIQHELPQAEIVVVDSSTDRTAEVARELGCVVLRQFPPRGQDLAMLEAFSVVKRNIVVTLDCDNTYPVESIKSLLQLIESGYDIASASRLGTRPKTMPFANYLANKFFAKLAWVICGVHSSDVHTGMRAYRRNLLSHFPFLHRSCALAVELQVGPVSMGYRCAEIMIDYRARIGISKLRRIEGAYWSFIRLWRWRWFLNPKRKRKDILP